MEGVEFVRRLDVFGGVVRSFVLVREFLSDGRFGVFPEGRSLEELLGFGVVNLDKPPGPTSHEVVAWVKELLGVSRAGHGGTLEPLT
ncbi:MAG: tRNA pseudouridine synthase A [Desulfurococcaceae archaeon TW002]